MRSFGAMLVVLLLVGAFGWSTGAVTSWIDAEGHIWVSNDILEWDVSHGSSFQVKVGSETREWRYYTNKYQYAAYLGSGGNAQHSPGYAHTHDGDDRTFENGTIINQPDGSVTVSFDDLMTHDEYEYPLNHGLTFFEDSGLVRVDFSVGNVTSDPNPPGFEYQLSLTPGGDKSNDFYYYPGKAAEGAYPYGSWDAIYSSEMGSVSGFSYITVYDKAVMQGLAVIADTSELANFITDMNYGVAQIGDATYYANYSHAELCLDGTLDTSFFYLVYQYDPADPYGPIEYAIEAIVNGEVPLYSIDPVVDPPVPEPTPAPRPTLEERLAERFEVSPQDIAALIELYGQFNVKRAAIGALTFDQLLLALEGIDVEGLGPGGALVWEDVDAVRIEFLATTSTGTPISIPTAGVSIIRSLPGGDQEVVGFYMFERVGNSGRHRLSIPIDVLGSGSYSGYIESAMLAIEVPISFVLD